MDQKCLGSRKNIHEFVRSNFLCSDNHGSLVGNWKWFIVVIALAAMLKVAWSVIFSGEAGLSILKPAISGLVICIIGITVYWKRQKSKT